MYSTRLQPSQWRTQHVSAARGAARKRKGGLSVGAASDERGVSRGRPGECQRRVRRGDVGGGGEGAGCACVTGRLLSDSWAEGPSVWLGAGLCAACAVLSRTARCCACLPACLPACGRLCPLQCVRAVAGPLSRRGCVAGGRLPGMPEPIALRVRRGKEGGPR